MKYVTTKKPLYKVYEISKEYTKHGKLLKDFIDKEEAEKCMEESIFRYIKTELLIIETKIK